MHYTLRARNAITPPCVSAVKVRPPLPLPPPDIPSTCFTRTCGPRDLAARARGGEGGCIACDASRDANAIANVRSASAQNPFHSALFVSRRLCDDNSDRKRRSGGKRCIIVSRLYCEIFARVTSQVTTSLNYF